MTPERALAHPMRARILTALREGDASPTELAKAFDEPLGVVSYHVRVLAQAGFLELVGQTLRRGAIQHHYRVRDRGIVGDRLSLPPEQAAELAAGLRDLVAAARRHAVPAGDAAVDVTVLLHRTPGEAAA